MRYAVYTHMLCIHIYILICRAVSERIYAHMDIYRVLYTQHTRIWIYTEYCIHSIRVYGHIQSTVYTAYIYTESCIQRIYALVYARALSLSLYVYISRTHTHTNTSARRRQRAVPERIHPRDDPRDGQKQLARRHSGPQFTCFTSTKYKY